MMKVEQMNQSRNAEKSKAAQQERARDMEEVEE